MSADHLERAVDLAAKIPELANQDADIQRRAARFDCDWIIRIGEVDLHMHQRAGHLGPAERGPFFMRQWSFALSASPEAWLAFWEPVPRPGFHDILALSKRGDLVIQGDITPLMRNLQVVKDIVATPRALNEASAEARP